MYKFYIINDVDRPDQEHVVQRLGDTQKGAYIHQRLRNWNKKNGNFQIVDSCPNIKDFGFDIKISGGRAIFNKVRPSVVKYRDGSTRHWQGFSCFILLLYEKALEIHIEKTTIFRTSALPEWHIEHNGGNTYHVYYDGKQEDVFTRYNETPHKIAMDYFTDKALELI